MKNTKYLIVFAILVCFLSINFLSTKIVLATNVGLQTNSRILFVVDTSHSMNSQDKNKNINDIIKLFIDTLPSTNYEIGLIYYNDTIVDTYSFSSLSSTENRISLKEKIDSVRKFGSTDIGLAINYAMDMIAQDDKKNTSIILFSDGETDLSFSRTGRKLEDSLIDENSAYEKSKNMNVPIYTVAVSKDGKLNPNYLNKISSTTNAKTFFLNNSMKNFFSVYRELFDTICDVKVKANSNIIIADGTLQSLNIKIPGIYTNESNIIIKSDKEIKNISLLDESSTLMLHNYANNYATLKIKDNTTNSVNLNIVAAKDSNLNIFEVNNIDVWPKLIIPENLYMLDIPIEMRLYSYNDINISDAKFYEDIEATLNIEYEDSTVETFKMENKGNVFVATIKNNFPQIVKISADVKKDNYEQKASTVFLQLSNRNPEKIKVKQDVLKNSKQKTFNLNNYFKDPDEEKLKYEIIKDDDILEGFIQENELNIKTFKQGLAVLSIVAKDQRGGSVTADIAFNVLPIWLYYKSHYLWIIIIFIILFAGYLIFSANSKKNVPSVISDAEKNKKTPGTFFSNAKFEGYFLNTLSGNDIPILVWNASYIESKNRVSLGELFHMLDVQENLPEAHKIYFESANNGKIIFYHDTMCIVNFGNITIPARRKEILSYNDKLYIIFNDTTTEIEIRYKYTKKNRY